MKKNQIKVTVTQKDIDTGIADNCLECPIARALKRTTRKEWAVWKDNVFTSNVKACNYKQYDLPNKAQRFIEKFDERKPVKPFSFILK